MEKEKENDSAEPSTCQKVVKTAFLVLTWVCIGLSLEIQGPTFKDLKIRTNGSTEEISRAISGRSIGFFVGAAIGGFLVDKFTRFCFLMIAVCLDLISVMSVVAPWAPNPGVLWGLFFLQGTFEGVINIAGQKLILQIWKEKASSPLHLLHFGFGMGSFIVPNIANPFLAVSVKDDEQQMPNATGRLDLSTTTSSFVQSTNASTTITKYIKESEVQWAYIIVAVITVSNSLVFYLFQLLSRKNTPTSEVNHDFNQSSTKTSNFSPKSLLKIIDPATCTGGKRIFGIQIFILLFLFFFNAVGGERLYGKFIRNFSIDKFDFSNDSGSLINTSFWISFALGRFAGFVVAIWIPIRILILIEVSGALVSAILLNIFAYDNELMLWIFTQPMGFFIAPLFPSGVAWGDSYVEMTGMGITFLLLGGGIGGMSYMWIIGHFYDDYHRSFLYMIGAYGGIVVLLALIMTFVARGHPLRMAKEKTIYIEKDELNHNEKSENTRF